MPRASTLCWVTLVALILVFLSIVPVGANQESSWGFASITNSVALERMEGLLRNISQTGSESDGWLIRSNFSPYINRGYLLLRRSSLNWDGLPVSQRKIKTIQLGYFIPLMVIGLFFIFYQSSRIGSKIDSNVMIFNNSLNQ